MAIASINPATGETIRTYEEMPPEQAAAAVSQAHETWLAWRTTSFAQRSKPMKKTAEILRRIREERAEYIVTHQGKPVAMLLPVAEEALEKAMLQAGRQGLSGSWETYARLADELRSQWPAALKTQEALDALRR